jgi:hypothetical protein
MALDKDIKIGSNGDVDFQVRADGKIQIALTFGQKWDSTDTEVDASVKVVQGEKVLLDKLVAGLPAGLLKQAAQAAENLALGVQAAAAPPAAVPSA